MYSHQHLSVPIQSVVSLVSRVKKRKLVEPEHVRCNSYFSAAQQSAVSAGFLVAAAALLPSNSVALLQ